MGMFDCAVETGSIDLGARVCRGCRCADQLLLGCKSGYELLKCRLCGSISTRLPADEPLRTRIYENYYNEASFEIPAATARSLDNLVASFEPFRRTGRLIDIGFGEGGLLSAAEGQ